MVDVNFIIHNSNFYVTSYCMKKCTCKKNENLAIKKILEKKCFPLKEKKPADHLWVVAVACVRVKMQFTKVCVETCMKKVWRLKIKVNFVECYQSAYYSLSTYSVSNLVVPNSFVGFFLKYSMNCWYLIPAEKLNSMLGYGWLP